jgi:hypothetical protein
VVTCDPVGRRRSLDIEVEDAATRRARPTAELVVSEAQASFE